MSRTPPYGLVDRLAEDLVRAVCAFTELPGIGQGLGLDLDVVSRCDPPDECWHGGREAELAQDLRLVGRRTAHGDRALPRRGASPRSSTSPARSASPPGLRALVRRAGQSRQGAESDRRAAARRVDGAPLVRPARAWRGALARRRRSIDHRLAERDGHRLRARVGFELREYVAHVGSSPSLG